MLLFQSTGDKNFKEKRGMKRIKIKYSWRYLIIIGGLFCFLAQTGFAKEGPVIRTQGLINPGGNLNAGYLLINEMRIYLNPSTQIMDHRGIPIPTTELKPKKWVYLELEKDLIRNAIKAKKIYLLPCYIRPEEKRQYPFMK
ncbi:MAG: hypothetical protein A2157_05490 [Deltaproteobacteria bacterium RBG_16_47_11]|nr:MAG: hypothetical protein A2157_05490 [Deltaproteobacteria bacterium RBG_16_47_11]